ncbi:MAG: hypothetical protein KME57_01090 [Scytonema hyalinum WJT4-NPBG1]|jgi:hypothetical protein|nr:hypothetical protein [Scytonema hyalinum WJT4-NPBG1]
MQSSYTLKFFARWRNNGCKKVGTPQQQPYSFFMKRGQNAIARERTALWAIAF